MLPSRALNDVFIGESISARVSYFEMNVNSKCNSKHKCSGLVVATGLRMGMNWIYANVFDVLVLGSVKTSTHPFHMHDVLRAGIRLLGMVYLMSI